MSDNVSDSFCDQGTNTKQQRLRVNNQQLKTSHNINQDFEWMYVLSADMWRDQRNHQIKDTVSRFPVGTAIQTSYSVGTYIIISL